MAARASGPCRSTCGTPIRGSRCGSRRHVMPSSAARTGNAIDAVLRVEALPMSHLCHRRRRGGGAATGSRPRTIQHVGMPADLAAPSTTAWPAATWRASSAGKSRLVMIPVGPTRRPGSPGRLAMKSWVIGLGCCTPRSAEAMAAASAVPIPNSRTRSPVRSLSLTQGSGCSASACPCSLGCCFCSSDLGRAVTSTSSSSITAHPVCRGWSGPSVAPLAYRTARQIDVPGPRWGAPAAPTSSRLVLGHRSVTSASYERGSVAAIARASSIVTPIGGAAPRRCDRRRAGTPRGAARRASRRRRWRTT